MGSEVETKTCVIAEVRETPKPAEAAVCKFHAAGNFSIFSIKMRIVCGFLELLLTEILDKIHFYGTIRGGAAVHPNCGSYEVSFMESKN